MDENKQLEDESAKFTVKIISADFGELSIGNENIILFEMIEDIYSVSMVAKLIFQDTHGAVELLPLTGNEYVAVIYGEEETSKVFVIYDFKKIHQGVTTMQSTINTLEMYLVEPTHLALTHHKFSKSWVDAKISDIVQDICQWSGMSTFENFEETREILPYFYIPYWTPLEAIKWLLARASGAKSGKAGYLFYSNSEGLNCQSMELLFREGKFEKDREGKIMKYYIIKTDEIDKNSLILSYNIEPINYQSLVYLSGGSRLGYDFETKSFLTYTSTYEDIISKYTMMGKKTLFQDVSSDDAYSTIEGDNDSELLKNIAYGEFIKRYSKQFIVSILVRGNERRYAGMMIDIPWKSSLPTEIMHKMYEGKFLVKSITHQFSGKIKPNYRQLLVLIKTGYTSADSKILHTAPIFDSKVPVS